MVIRNYIIMFNSEKLRTNNCFIIPVNRNLSGSLSKERRNWLFSASPKGADVSAAVYSVIETAKANGLNPYEYLKFIFKNLPGVQFGQHPKFLEDFLPWDPEVQSLCKKSDN